ncbi:hypothetical protein BpHYR1_007932, partial [Brachionus plicatilis]
MNLLTPHRRNIDTNFKKNYKIPIKKIGLGYLSNYRIFYKKLYKIFIKFLTGVQSAYNVHFEKLKITNKHIQTKLANLTLFFILNFGSIQKPIKNKPFQLNNQSFRMKYFVRKYSCKISKKIFVK